MCRLISIKLLQIYTSISVWKSNSEWMLKILRKLTAYIIIPYTLDRMIADADKATIYSRNDALIKKVDMTAAQALHLRLIVGSRSVSRTNLCPLRPEVNLWSSELSFKNQRIRVAPARKNTSIWKDLKMTKPPLDILEIAEPSQKAQVLSKPA